jgi:hypothetical protein
VLQENSKKCYVERGMTKRKIRKVDKPSMIAERGGRGIGAIKTTIKGALDSSNIFSLIAY